MLACLCVFLGLLLSLILMSILILLIFSYFSYACLFPQLLGWESREVRKDVLETLAGDSNLISNIAQTAVLGGLYDVSSCSPVTLLSCLLGKEDLPKTALIQQKYLLLKHEKIWERCLRQK